MKQFFCIIFLFFSFALNAQIITTVAGNGTAGYSGDSGPATSTNISSTTHFITFDKYGNYYFSESAQCRIRKVDTNGIITTVAGTGTLGYGGDGGTATAALLTYPEGVTCDTIGNLYIADHQNYRIRKVDIATGIITTYAGVGTVGDSGDGGSATAAEIFPDAIQFDKYGNLYVTTGTYNKIRKINPSGIITTIAGTGIIGSTGDGGPATAAELYNPVNCTVDDTGNVYFPEVGRIRKISVAGIVTTFAGNGVGVYNGDGMAATSTQMEPLFLISENNMIYFSDTNQRVRIVDAARIVHTIAGTGVNGYNGDGGQATAAQLNEPAGITLDACGNVYFVDEFNYRIRKVALNPACWPEGVQNITTTHTINIYPNPAYNNLTITASDKINSVIIYNFIGQTVYYHTYNTSKAEVNIAALPEGMYMVEVITSPLERPGEAGRRTVNKIVKQ